MQQDLDKFIDSLVEAQQSVTPEQHPLVRTLPLLAFILVFMSIVTFFIGLRSDWKPEYITEFGLFPVELMLSFCMGVTALLATGWLRVPYMKTQRLMTSIALGVAAVFFSLAVYRLISEGVGFARIESLIDCYKHSIVLAALPTACLVYFQKTGSSTHPYLSALMGTLAIAGFAWICLRLTCSVNLAGHNALVQLSPFMLLGAGLGVYARKLYRW